MTEDNPTCSISSSTKEKRLVIDGYMMLEQYTIAKEYENFTHAFHSFLMYIIMIFII